MRDAACVRIQHFFLVFLLLLLVTLLFVVSPQVAAQFGHLPVLQAMTLEPQSAHRQPASDGKAAQTVSIPGGEFSMGSDEPQFPDARPWHRVHVDGFHMDRMVVTNADYAAFVRATGYVTVAEQIPNAKDYPGASPEKLVAGSVVFAPPETAVALAAVASFSKALLPDPVDGQKQAAMTRC